MLITHVDGSVSDMYDHKNFREKHVSILIISIIGKMTYLIKALVEACSKLKVENIAILAKWKVKAK